MQTPDGLSGQRDYKPRDFVSYHHGEDRRKYLEFAFTVAKTHEAITDTSVRQEIRSNNSEYVIRRIREKNIANTSCTAVLCGNRTGGRRFVDWEIDVTLDMKHSLVGIVLPEIWHQTWSEILPPRLWRNVDSGFAALLPWSTVIEEPNSFKEAVELVHQRDRALIMNDQPRIQKSKPMKPHYRLM